MHYIKNRVSPFIISLTASLLLSHSPAEAQFAESHLGVRGGMYGGIYYQNIIPAGTAETSFFAMISASRESVRATVLKLTYETSLSEIADNLFFVWGYGGHAGFSVTDHTYFLGRKYQFEYSRFRPLMGMDGWAGLEYRFITVPFSIGLNLKPYFELMFPGFVSMVPGDIGLTFAYTF
ncbi:MAG: hypothetical protein JW965_04655 [Bacteroidales bacterium]|nr:hypothetical protein [Bacteroidales bacterium]